MISVQDYNATKAILFEVNQYGCENLMNKTIDTRLHSFPYNFDETTYGIL